MRMEVYLARESKISRLLELEADAEKLSRTNARLIAQIQRLETERNEIAQKLSKVRTSRSAREQTTIYWIATPWRMKGSCCSDCYLPDHRFDRGDPDPRCDKADPASDGRKIPGGDR